MADLIPWINMAIRWFHVICGIAWIGASFYFVWLDNSLRPAADKKDRDAGVDGEVWSVHGGGFYHKQKYMVAPGKMPEELHWFKYEAYFTWISGFALLVLMYYFGADLYLIDPLKSNMGPLSASLTGLGFLAGGWIIYDQLCKSRLGQITWLFWAIWFGVIVAATWYLNTIFSGRGALIHIGALIGTTMVANVFFVIIPNQKKVVADLISGKKPDPALGKAAKQRSVHNNYMTLPVILAMISNHYPVLYSNQHSWIVIAGIFASSALIRHFFNLKHSGRVEYTYPILGISLFVLVMFMTPWLYSQDKKETAMAGTNVTMSDIQQMISTHCSACHSKKPTHVDFTEPPSGVMFDTEAQIRRYAARIRARAVEATDMPLGNETGMTAEERQLLGAGLDQIQTKQ